MDDGFNRSALLSVRRLSCPKTFPLQYAKLSRDIITGLVELGIDIRIVWRPTLDEGQFVAIPSWDLSVRYYYGCSIIAGSSSSSMYTCLHASTSNCTSAPVDRTVGTPARPGPLVIAGPAAFWRHCSRRVECISTIVRTCLLGE